jgi:hypothetical protein
MLKTLGFTLSGCLALSFWTATLAAPAPQDRPGIVGQSRVTIENRGRSEAVPVSVQEWFGDRPLSVQLAGTSIVQIAGTPIVDARIASRGWSYRTVRILSGQDLAGMLNAAGSEGWEVTGVQTSDASGTSLLLKRPR